MYEKAEIEAGAPSSEQCYFVGMWLSLAVFYVALLLS